MAQWCYGPNHPSGEYLPDEKFQIKTPTRRQGSLPTTHRAKICKDCQITQRNAKRDENPYLHAFKARRQDHAKRLHTRVGELIALGWDAELRALEMRHQFEHGYCPICPYRHEGEPTLNFYRDMKEGLKELTIDIFTPALPPIWPGNVWWVCKTCNIRMQREGKHDYAKRVLAEHELRKRERGRWDFTVEQSGQLRLL
jgi:hypothetical protein